MAHHELDGKLDLDEPEAPRGIGVGRLRRRGRFDPGVLDGVAVGAGHSALDGGQERPGKKCGK